MLRIMAGLAALALPFSAMAQEKVLKAVMHADVRVIDPIWTTQTIANIHGALVYDTLFGNDANQKPQPQMVGKYEISPDRLTYTFTLRDGLKFHDGSPVTSKDAIASIKRWGAKDGVGQRLMGYVTALDAVDDKTFKMVLREPYGMVLESLGKSGSSIAAIMREKDAQTDPQQQVKESVGSGPYIFAKDQWVPGSKAVYLKNKDYVPRTEAPSSFAGAKIPGVDRIELIWISDPQTAMSALVNGEIDFYENPNIDFLPLLAKARGREADEDRHDRQHAGHDPAQSPASALQQREGAAGDVPPDQPGGLPARHRRRSQVLPRLPRPADLRRPVRERRRHAPSSRTTIPRRRCSSSRRRATTASRSPSSPPPTTTPSRRPRRC